MTIEISNAVTRSYPVIAADAACHVEVPGLPTYMDDDDEEDDQAT